MLHLRNTKLNSDLMIITLLFRSKKLKSFRNRKTVPSTTTALIYSGFCKPH